MPRYMRQRDMCSCAPVALINAGKWAGKRLTRARDLRRFQKLCNVRPPDGAHCDEIEEALRLRGELRIRRMRHHSILKIEQHLRRGGAAVAALKLIYDRQEGREAHCALLIGISDSGKSYLTVNYGLQRPTLAYVRRTTLLNDFRRRAVGRMMLPRVWLISKR